LRPNTSGRSHFGATDNSYHSDDYEDNDGTTETKTTTLSATTTTAGSGGDTTTGTGTIATTPQTITTPCPFTAKGGMVGYPGGARATARGGKLGTSFANKLTFALLNEDDGTIKTIAHLHVEGGQGGPKAKGDFAGAPTDDGYAAVFSSSYAYAALKDDGSVSTWGGEWWSWTEYDGRVTPNGWTQSKAPSDKDYVAVFSTGGAFAAIKDDGSISAFGVDMMGGSSVDSTSPDHNGWSFTGAPSDKGYEAIYSNNYSFSALKQDGSITTWGARPKTHNNQVPKYFGRVDMNAYTAPPTDAGYMGVTSTGIAFAALKKDGTVVTWGIGVVNGAKDNEYFPKDKGYIALYSNAFDFMAIKEHDADRNGDYDKNGDGPIKVWTFDYGYYHHDNGDRYSGTSVIPSGAQSKYHDFYNDGLQPTTVLHKDGSLSQHHCDVYAPCPEDGGCGKDITFTPANDGFVAVYATTSSFSALKKDGSITTWGEHSYLGWSKPTDTGYVIVSATETGFSALNKDGTIGDTWGETKHKGVPSDPMYGIESPYVALYSNDGSWVAQKADGSVQVYGSINANNYVSGKGWVYSPVIVNGKWKFQGPSYDGGNAAYCKDGAFTPKHATTTTTTATTATTTTTTTTTVTTVTTTVTTVTTIATTATFTTTTRTTATQTTRTQTTVTAMPTATKRTTARTTSIRTTATQTTRTTKTTRKKAGQSTTSKTGTTKRTTTRTTTLRRTTTKTTVTRTTATRTTRTWSTATLTTTTTTPLPRCNGPDPDLEHPRATLARHAVAQNPNKQDDMCKSPYSIFKGIGWVENDQGEKIPGWVYDLDCYNDTAGFAGISVRQLCPELCGNCTSMTNSTPPRCEEKEASWCLDTPDICSGLRSARCKNHDGCGWDAETRTCSSSNPADLDSIGLCYDFIRDNFTNPIAPYTYASISGTLNGDLNQGAGGHYIYLCVQSAFADERTPARRFITDITLTQGDCPNTDYTKDPYDLNSDAGGKYIFLCVKRGDGSTNERVVTGISISSVQDASDGWDLVNGPGLNGDLNQGIRKSKDVFLHMKLEVPSANGQAIFNVDAARNKCSAARSQASQASILPWTQWKDLCPARCGLCTASTTSTTATSTTTKTTLATTQFEWYNETEESLGVTPGGFRCECTVLSFELDC
jgi:hypothetical protein